MICKGKSQHGIRIARESYANDNKRNERRRKRRKRIRKKVN